MLARIDRLNADIDELTGVIKRLLARMRDSWPRPGRCPAGGARAQDALAETGAGMTRSATGAHLASQAGRTPLENSFGKRTGRAKAKKGNRYPGGLFGETAIAVGKAQTREGARYRRLARRRGKPKAQVAVGNTQLKAGIGMKQGTSSMPSGVALSFGPGVMHLCVNFGHIKVVPC